MISYFPSVCPSIYSIYSYLFINLFVSHHDRFIRICRPIRLISAFTLPRSKKSRLNKGQHRSTFIIRPWILPTLLGAWLPSEKTKAHAILCTWVTSSCNRGGDFLLCWSAAGQNVMDPAIPRSLCIYNTYTIYITDTT